MDGGARSVPMPGGGPPIEFPLVAQGERSIEFANPAHDFPQRIRYWREGDRLHAEISLLDGVMRVHRTTASINGSPLATP